MRQLNFAVRADIADKFDQLCDGVSKSAIMTQWINEKAREQLAVKPPVSTPTYSILTGE